MAKKSTAASRPLVIVESPAKARTIGKFLGDNFMIEASIGHVRDLPKGKKELPVEFKKETWAYLGINVDDNFTPVYVVPERKREQVKKLKALLKDATELYLATDEDREGEAISWHLTELLQPKIPFRRLVFHEITKEAIRLALENPREILYSLVHAQETRRIVDRLFGYDVSPLLWRKFGKPGLSAGRVQSVAVRAIVERERERIAFRSSTYWDLWGAFQTGKSEALKATLITVDGKKIPSSRDFDSKTGKIKGEGFLVLGETEAKALAAKVGGKSFTVSEVEEKPYTTKPYPPFMTSTLQQEASRKLRFAARRTMQVAQSLYENGHVTYIRTDSTNLAAEAITAARALVESQFGKEYLPEQPRTYSTKVKNAQEAHEAIRPSGEFATPQSMQDKLGVDEWKLYDLIWKRTIASQMTDARGRRISVTLSGEGTEFHASGKTIDFPGYLRAYVEGSDDPEADLADQEIILPSVKTGEKIACDSAEPKSHTTEPPGRFTEPRLIQTLEQLGIGRPSTYATIMETILEREYAVKKGGALVPTWTALAVIQLLETYFPSLIDYKFTARMEDDLDAISRGEAEHVAYLNKFYFGVGEPGLKQQVATQIDQIDPRVVGRVAIGTPEGEPPIVVRVGRFGPFLEQGESTAPLPADICPDELTIAKAKELIANAKRGEEPLGTDPATSKPVYFKQGRFGPYVQLGVNGEGEEKPKYASILKGMKPDDVTLEMALKLLSLPLEIGKHPESGEPVQSCNGRFGPYVKCGKENRSLPAEMSPLEVTLEQALALLAQPKQPRRGFGAKREPLKVLGKSPITSADVQIFNGRFGPYVTDGKTNASLSRGMAPDELTMDEALGLLAARLAKGDPPKKAKAKRASGGAKKKKKKAAEEGTAEATE